MDRLDYLRRDSLFTGAGYGHFDHFRILNSFELVTRAKEPISSGRRNQNSQSKSTCLRVTTCTKTSNYTGQRQGFEKLLEAMWKRARSLRDDGTKISLVPAIQDFWSAAQPSVSQYLRIEEFTVMQQIQLWADHKDEALSHIANCFLNRIRFVVIEPPPPDDPMAPNYHRWEAKLHEVVRRGGFTPAKCYCLKDQVKGKYNQPYFPEKESDEQSTRQTRFGSG